MDIDIPVAELHTYDFALTTARQHGNRRAIRQLETIGPPPHLDVKKFTTRARWAANFGGVASGTSFTSLSRDLLASLVRSPDYSVTDIIRTLRGITASQAALLPQLATTDLVTTMPRLGSAHRPGAGPPRPGSTRQRDAAIPRLNDRTQQATGVVRRIGPHPTPRGTRQVPGPAHQHESQPSRESMTDQDAHSRPNERRTGESDRQLQLPSQQSAQDGLA